MKKRHVRISRGLKMDFYVDFISEDGVSQGSFNFVKLEEATELIQKWIFDVNPSGRAGSSQWAIGR